jgi:hypothetical protein
LQNWTKSAVLGLLIASLAPSSALPQDLTVAQADSLVSYIEALEFDLAVCDIRGSAESDSLRVQLDILGYRLSIAESARAKWYQDPRIWFLFGAAAATFVIGQTVQLTF